MADLIKIKRGTRAQLDAAAASSGLNAGEPYLITDEGILAIGLTTSTYAESLPLDDPLLAGYRETGVSSISGITSSSTVTVPLDGRTYEGTLSGNVTLAVDTSGLSGTQVGHGILVIEQDANGYDISSYPATWFVAGDDAAPATSGEKLELIITRMPSGDIHMAGRTIAVP